MRRISPSIARLSRPIRQRGFSLVTTLLFMLAAMVLGVSVMGINVMQERMIGNSKDRDLAFQAAEAALRDAEQDVSLSIGEASVFTDTCTAGLCTAPSSRATPSSLPVEKQTGFDWNPAGGMVRTYGAMTSVPAFPGVSAPPVYFIENLGVLPPAPGDSAVDDVLHPRLTYRITARATGARAETVVVLQSVYFKR